MNCAGRQLIVVVAMLVILLWASFDKTPLVAQIVHIDPPTLLDTNVNLYPAADFGRIPPIFPQSGFLSSNDTLPMLLLNASPTPYLWSAWTLDSTGVFEDRGSFGVGNDTSGSDFRTFIPKTVSQDSSRYDIYGTIILDRTRRLAFQTVSARLNTSQTFTSTSLLAPPGSWVASPFGFWSVYRTGLYFSIFLYDEKLNDLVMNDNRVTNVGGPLLSGSFYADSAVYVSYQTLDSVIVCDRINHNGDISRVCVVPGFQYNYRRNYYYSAKPIGNDSVLFCHLDTTLAGELRANYFVNDKAMADDTLTMSQVTFPYKPSDRNSPMYTFDVHGDDLSILPQAWRDNLVYLKFNWRTQANVDSATFVNVKTPRKSHLLGYRSIGDRGQYFYISGPDVIKLDFSLASPLSDNSLSSIYRFAEYYRSPTIVRDGADILLYSQRAQGSDLSLQGYRIGAMDMLPVLDTFTALAGGRKPFRPALVSLDSQKVLFWYEDVTSFDSTVQADTTFLAKVVTFRGDFPTTEDILTEQSVVYAPRSYDYRPTFVQIGDYVYFDVLRWLYPGYYDHGHRVRLHRVNLTSGALDPKYFNFGSAGKLGLIRANDSLLLTRSWFTCTESSGPNFDYCLRWRGGYSVEYFYGFESMGGLELFSVSEESEVYVTNDANARVWSDLNGSALLTTLPKRSYTLSTNSSVLQEGIDLSSYTQRFGIGSDLHPVKVGEYICVLVTSAYSFSADLVLFDRKWNFVASSDVPLKGVPLEFSEIIPLHETNELVFAYAAYLPERYSSSRIILQKIKLDITTSVEDHQTVEPESYFLGQNYPNPFNPSTRIALKLPVASAWEIVIYNILGQRVDEYSGNSKRGEVTIDWDGSEYASGVYFYRARTGEFVATRKMVLLK
jgi:Secretion system C-terminal sorting domain